MTTSTDTIQNIALTSDTDDMLAAREELALLDASELATIEATDGSEIQIVDAYGDRITASQAIADIDEAIGLAGEVEGELTPLACDEAAELFAAAIEGAETADELEYRGSWRDARGWTFTLVAGDDADMTGWHIRSYDEDEDIQSEFVKRVAR